MGIGKFFAKYSFINLFVATLVMSIGPFFYATFIFLFISRSYDTFIEDFLFLFWVQRYFYPLYYLAGFVFIAGYQSYKRAKIKKQFPWY